MNGTNNGDDPILVYLDETGDHSLEKIDKDFPLFILTTILVRKTIYLNEIVPSVYKLKIDNFGHEGAILHSRHIRKAYPPFEFLLNQIRRKHFLESISGLIGQLNFKLIVSAIKKEKLLKVYSKPYNPYDLALKFSIERIIILLKKINQKRVRLIAESRGEKEDNELKLAFYKILKEGTERIRKEEFDKIDFILSFIPKPYNIIGTQLADLCGYPIGRYILNPKKPNKPYEIIKHKILGKIDGWDCFKIFP